MAADSSRSKQRSGSSSMIARSSSVGSTPSAGPATEPSSTTWLSSVMPYACWRKLVATRPSATRAAVSRALARSRIGRASSKSYFCMPTRSACPGPRPGQRGVAGATGQHLVVDRIGRHHGLPLGPLGVADLDGDRSALGLAVPDTAEDGDLIGLELHPGPATEAEPAPRERVGDVGAGHLYVGRESLQDRHQGGPVRLARRQPSEHRASVPGRTPRLHPVRSDHPRSRPGDQPTARAA